MFFVLCLFIIVCAGDSAIEGFGFNALTVIKDVEIHTIKPRLNSGTILLDCHTESEFPTGLIFNTNKCSIEGVPTEITLNQIVTVTFNTNIKVFNETISITVMEEDLQPKILYKTYPSDYECGSNLFKDMSVDSYPDTVIKTGYVDELFFETDSPKWSEFGVDTVIQFSGYIHLIRAGNYIFYIDTNNEYKFILDNIYEVESTKCEKTYYNVTVNVTSSYYVPFVLFYHYISPSSSSSLPNYLKVIFSSNIYPRMIPTDRFFNIPQFPRYLHYPDLKLNLLLNRPVKYEPYVENTIPPSQYSIDNLLPEGLSLSLDTGSIYGTPTSNSDIKKYTIKATNRYGSTSYSFTLKIMDSLPSGILTKYYEIPSLECGNIPNLEDINKKSPTIILVEDNIDHINENNLYERWNNIALYDNYITVWEGRLSFTKEGKWLILIKANDEADVYINEELILSKRGCSSFNEEYLSYELYVDKLMLVVDIKVVYMQLNGAHGIQLYWRNNDYSLTVIPPSAFLYYPTYSFDYKYEKMVYRYNVTIPDNVPELFGIRNIIEFKIIPKLPDGLEIDKKNGVISGKTTEILDERRYTIECITSTITVSTSIIITVLENELPYFAFQNDKDEVITDYTATVGLIFHPITIIKYNSINYFDSPNLLTGLSINSITGTINGTILDLKHEEYDLTVCAHSITGDNCQDLHLNIETCSKNGFIFRLKKNVLFPNNTMLLIITGADGSELFRKSEENTINDNNYLICTTANGLHTLDISNPKKGNYKYSFEYLSGEIIEEGEIKEISNTISFTIGKSVLSISYTKGEIVSMIYEFITIEPIIYGHYTSITIDRSLPFGLTFHPNGTINGIPSVGQPRLAYVISLCNQLNCAVTRVTFTILGCDISTNNFYFTYHQISGPKETIKLEELKNNTVLFNILDSTNSFSKSFCGVRGNYQLSFYTTSISTSSLFAIKDDKGNILMNYKHEKRSNTQLQFSTMFLIEGNSHWNYIYISSDNNNNDDEVLIKNWMIQNYDDYSWNIGRSLIYPEISPTEISQYYRRTFDYDDRNYNSEDDNNPNSNNGLLSIGIRMNSCFIAYINGYKIHKLNIDDSDLRYDTICSSNSYNSNTDYIIFSIPSSYLIKGKNTIAVEIHQSPNPTNVKNIFDLHMSLLVGDELFRSGIFTITSSVAQTNDKDDPSVLINDEYSSIYYTTEPSPIFCLSRPDKQYESINNYVIYTGNGYPDYVPKAWKFYGTNKESVDCTTSWNENDWVLLDEKADLTLTEGTKYNYTISNNKPYLIYAFKFTETVGSVDGISLSYIQLYTTFREISDEYCVEDGWGLCYKNEYCHGKCPDSYEGYTSRKCEEDESTSLLSLSGSDLTKCIPPGPITFKYSKDEYKFDIDEEIEPIIPEYNVIERGIFTISPDISLIGLVFDENTGKITGKSTTPSIDTYTIIYRNIGGSLVNYITIIIDETTKCNPPKDELSWGYAKPNTSSYITCPEGYSGNLTRNCIDSNPPEYSEVVSNCITDPPKSFSYISSNFVLFKGIYTDSIIPQFVGANIKFEKNTELPLGLSLNEKTGIISGTPKVLLSPTQFRIKMSNDGGYLETVITITIKDIPKFKYEKNDFYLKLNTPYTFEVIKENEFDSTFDISDDLPIGIEFDKSTGKFSIPAQQNPLYFGTTVSSSVYGYTATFYVAFHIVGSLNDNDYDVDEIIFVANSQYNLDYPLKFPFFVSECQVTPSLPYGFRLTDECTIGGNPSVIQGTTVYTVIMNNPFEIRTVTIKLSVVENINNYMSKVGKFRYRVYNNVPLGCNFAIKDYNHNQIASQQYPSVINHAKSLGGATTNYYEVIEFLLTVDTSYDLWTFSIEGDNSIGLRIDEDHFITKSICQEEVTLEVKKRMYKGTHHIYLHHYRNTYSGSQFLKLFYSNSKTKKTLLKGNFIYPQITAYDIKYDSDYFSSHMETKFNFNSLNYFVDPIYTITPELPDGITMSRTTGSMSGVPTIYTDAIEYTIRIQSYFLICKKIVTIEILRHLPFVMRKQYFIIEDPNEQFIYDPVKYPTPIAQDFSYDYNFEFPYPEQGADGYPVEMNKALGVHISSVIHINQGGVRWSFEFWNTGKMKVYIFDKPFYIEALGNSAVTHTTDFFFTIGNDRKDLYFDFYFDITMPAGYKYFKYTISLVTTSGVFINAITDRVYGDIEGEMTYKRNPVTYPLNTLINRNVLVYKKTPPYNCSLSADSDPLPAGLVVSQINGDLYGTPTEKKGKNNYRIICYSRTGIVETTLTLTVVEGLPPSNVKLYNCQNQETDQLTLYVGSQPCSYRIVADNNPQTFTLSPSIPTGVTVEESIGVIGGSPPATVAEKVIQISASNFYGSDAKDVRFRVIAWQSTTYTFTITLTIKGSTDLSHYILKDKTAGTTLANQDLPPGSYSFIIKTASTNFEISVKAGKNVLVGSVIRDNKYILNIEEDAFTSESTVISKEFTIVQGIPRAFYHITDTKFFYYKMKTAITLYPSPACYITAHRNLIAAAGVSNKAGVLTASGRATCDVLMLADKMTSNSEVSAVVVVDCELCKSTDPNKVRTRIHITTTSGSVVAKVYDGSYDNYMYDVTITTTKQSICFENDFVIFKYEEKSAVVINYYGIGDYLIYSGSAYDGVHVIDHDTVNLYGEMRYFQGNPPANWKELNFNDASWTESRFPDYLMPNNKVKVYVRKKFTVPENCLGGYLGFVVRGIVYIDGVQVYSGMPGWPLPWKAVPIPYNILTRPNTEHIVAIQWGGDNTAGRIALMVDLVVHFEFAHNDLTNSPGLRRNFPLYNNQVFDFDPYTSYSGNPQNLRFTFTFNAGRPQYVNGISFIGGKSQVYYGFRVVDESEKLIARMSCVVFENQLSDLYMLSDFSTTSFRSKAAIIINGGTPDTILISGVGFLALKASDICDYDNGWVKTPTGSTAYRLCSYMLIDRKGHQRRKCNINKVWGNTEAVGCNVCGSDKSKLFISYSLEDGESFTVEQGSSSLLLNKYESENYTSICFSDTGGDLRITLSNTVMKPWSINSYIQVETFSEIALYRTTLYESGSKVFTFSLPLRGVQSDYYYRKDEQTNTDWTTEAAITTSPWIKGSLLDTNNIGITTYVRYDFTVPNNLKYIVLSVFYQDGYAIYLNGYLLEKVNLDDGYSFLSEATETYDLPQVKSYTLDPSKLTAGSTAKVAIEYHKKDRGDLDQRVLLDSVIYIAKDDEDYTIRSFSGKSNPAEYLSMFERDDVGYNGSCNPLPVIKYTFTNPQYITHYEFQTGEVVSGTLNRWRIKGVLEDGTVVLLHYVSYFRIVSDSNYKFSIQTPGVYTSLIIEILGCEKSVFTLKYIHYLSGLSTNNCPTDTIWYATPKNYYAEYLCSTFLYNTKGVAKRKCKSDGNWDNIDYSECERCNTGETKYYIKKSYLSKENCINEKFEIKNVLNNNNVLCEKNNNTYVSFCMSDGIPNAELELSSNTNQAWNYGSYVTISDESFFPITESTFDKSNIGTTKSTTFPSLNKKYGTSWKYVLSDGTTGNNYIYPFYRLINPGELRLSRKFTVVKSSIRQIISNIITNGGYKFSLNGNEIISSNYPLSPTTDQYSLNDCDGVKTFTINIPMDYLIDGENIIDVSYFTCKNMPMTQLYGAFDSNLIIYTHGRYLINRLKNDTYEYVFDSRKDTIYQSLCVQNVKIPYVFYNSQNHVINTYSLYFDGEPGFNSWTLSSELSDGSVVTIDTKNQYALIINGYYEFLVDNPGSYSNIIFTITKCTANYFTISDISYYNSETTSICAPSGHWEAALSGSTLQNSCADLLLYKTGSEKIKCSASGSFDPVDYSECNVCGNDESRIYLTKVGEDENEDYKIIYQGSEVEIHKINENENSVCIKSSANYDAYTIKLLTKNNDVNGWSLSSYLQIVPFNGESILFSRTLYKAKEMEFRLTPPIIPQITTWQYSEKDLSGVTNWMVSTANQNDWKEINNLLGLRNTVGVTSYLRKKFKVDSVKNLLYLNIDYSYKDGIIIYINDKEIIRRNLDNSGVGFSTKALSHSLQPTIENIDINPEKYLHDGDNYIAVEYHLSRNRQTTYTAVPFTLSIYGDIVRDVFQLPSKDVITYISKTDYTLYVKFVHLYTIEELRITSNYDEDIVLDNIEIIAEEEDVNKTSQVFYSLYIPKKETSKLLFKNTIHSKLVTVIFHNFAYNENKLSIRFYSYVDSSKQCKDSGIWTKTSANTKQYRSCFSSLLNRSGYQSRMCNANGEWDNVDNSECNVCNNNNNQMKLYYWFNVTSSSVKNGFILKQNGNTLFTSSLYNEKTEIFSYICISDTTKPVTIEYVTEPSNKAWSENTVLQFETVGGLVVSRNSYDGKNDKTKNFVLPSKIDSMKWKYSDSSSITVSDWLSSTYDLSSWNEGSYDTIKSSQSTVYLSKTIDIKLAENHNLMIEFYYYEGFTVYINHYLLESHNMNKHTNELSVYHMSIPFSYITEGKNRINVIFYRSQYSYNDYILFDLKLLLDYASSLSYYSTIGPQTFAVDSRIDTVFSSSCKISVEITSMFSNNLNHHIYGYTIRGSKFNFNSWSIYDVNGRLYDTQNNYALSTTSENTFLFSQTVYTNLLIFSIRNCGGNEVFLSDIMYNIVSSRSICLQDNIWHNTAAGITVNLPCSYGLYNREGEQSRTCVKSGNDVIKWGNVDYGKCRICSNADGKKTIKLYTSLTCSVDCKSLNIVDDNNRLYEDLNDEYIKRESCYEINKVISIKLTSSVVQNVSIEIETVGGNPLLSTKLEMKVNVEIPLIFTTPFVGLNEEMKYYITDPSDPDWKTSGYDDRTWSKCSFPNCLNTEITTYYRTVFRIDNLEILYNVIIEVYYNEGFIFNVNGEEIMRENLPTTNVDSTTEATSSTSNSFPDTMAFSIPLNKLVSGDNIISVEYHKESSGTSYTAFDFMIYIINGPEKSIRTLTGNSNYLSLFNPNIINRNEELKCSFDSLSINYYFYSQIAEPINYYKIILGDNTLHYPKDWKVEVYDGNRYTVVHEIKNYQYIGSNNNELSFYLDTPISGSSYRITFTDCNDDELLPIAHIEFIIALSSEACPFTDYWSTTPRGIQATLTCLIGFKDKEKYQTRQCNENNDKSEWGVINDAACGICASGQSKIYIIKYNKNHPEEESVKIGTSNTITWTADDANKTATKTLCLTNNAYLDVVLSDSGTNDENKGWDEGSYVEIQTFTGFVLFRGSISKGVITSDTFKIGIPQYPLRGVWKYTDSDLSSVSNWYNKDYDDGSWSNESSISSESITVYLRKSIALSFTKIKSLQLSILSIGGYIIYFNNQLVGMYGVDTTSNYNTFSTTTSYPSEHKIYSIDSNLVINGNNVIAIEFHKEDLASNLIQFDLEVIYDESTLEIIPSFTSQYYDYCDNNKLSYFLYPEFPYSIELEYPNSQYFNAIKLISGPTIAGFCEIKISAVDDGTILYNDNNYYVDANNTQTIPLTNTYQYKTIEIKFERCEEQLTIAEYSILYKLVNVKCSKDEMWPETVVNSEATIPCSKLYYSSYGLLSRKCEYNAVSNTGEWSDVDPTKCNICNDVNKEQIEIEMKSLNENETFIIREVTTSKVVYDKESVNNFSPYICIDEGKEYEIQLIEKNDNIWSTISFVALKNSVDSYLLYRSYSVKELNKFRFSTSIISRFSKWSISTNNVQADDADWKKPATTSTTAVTWTDKNAPYFVSNTITTYLRKEFDIANKEKIGGVYIRLYSSDGIIVYLNGNLIYKYNMIDGGYWLNTMYANDKSDLKSHDIFTDNQYLVNGTNRISVEFHKSHENDNNKIFILDILLTVAELNSDEYIYDYIIPHSSNSDEKCVSGMVYYFDNDNPPITINLIRFSSNNESLLTGINYAKLYGYETKSGSNNRVKILELTKEIQPDISGSFVVLDHDFYSHFELEILECNDDNDFIIIPPSAIEFIYSSKQWCDSTYDLPTVYKNQSVLLSSTTLDNCQPGYNGIAARQCNMDLTWSNELSQKECKMIPPSLHYKEINQAYYQQEFVLKPDDFENVKFIAKMTINPELRSGLESDGNYTISGIPLNITNCVKYEIRFVNEVGEFAQNVTICINGKPTEGKLDDITWFINTPMSFTPTTDYYIEEYLIRPELPNNLKLNPKTGEISGQSDTMCYQIPYLIIAKNRLGSVNIPFTITLVTGPSYMVYEPSHYIFYVGRNYETSKPSYTGIITEYKVNNLPSGLSINDKTGVISGIAETKTTEELELKIIGSNPAGETSTTIYLSIEDRYCLEDGDWPLTSPGIWVNISCPMYFNGYYFRLCVDSVTPEWSEIVDKCSLIPPRDFSYEISDMFYYKQPIVPIEPKIYGIIEEYEINPTLPNNLILSKTTGTITGIPLEIGKTSHIITAKNSEGEISTNIEIEIGYYECEADKDWPQTKIDKEVVLSCGKDKYGTMTRECISNSIGNDIKAEWGPVNDLDCLSTNLSLSSEQAYIYTTFSLNITSETINENDKNIKADGNSKNVTFSPTDQRYLVSCLAKVMGVSSRDLVIESYKINNNGTTITIKLRWLIDKSKIEEKKIKIPVYLYTPLFQNYINSKTKFFDFSTLDINSKSSYINEDNNETSKTVSIVVYCLIFGILFIALGSVYGYLQYRKKHPKASPDEIKP